MQVFDHSADGPLLYFKERFVGANYPRQSKMVVFSATLRRLGLSDTSLMGPREADFAGMLEKAGLNENLNKRRK
jgi:hypothetical protein